LGSGSRRFWDMFGFVIYLPRKQLAEDVGHEGLGGNRKEKKWHGDRPEREVFKGSKKGNGERPK